MNNLPNIPIGFIALFPGENVPDNWRICDGQSLQKSDIPDSFEELATALGQTEGDSLQLPDLSDRFVVGAGIDAELRSSGEPDQHTHQNDPPPQRRYTSYGDQFPEAESTQYFKEDAIREQLIRAIDMDVAEEEITETPEEIDQGQLPPMSLEHHNHYVELDIEPFESEPSEGLNRPKYYALHFVIRVA